jgi:hypothetical protein
MKRFASLLIAFLGMAGGAWAQSLLEAGSSPGAGPYDLPKPPSYKKHDLIEIQFVERPRAGAGETIVSIMAEVTDLRPNGTLVLQATRKLKVNGEDESVALTAEAAPQSITGGKVRFDKLAHLHYVRQSGEKKDR